jgi:hypothetical protein
LYNSNGVSFLEVLVKRHAYSAKYTECKIAFQNKAFFSLTALFSVRLKEIKKGKTSNKTDFSLSVAAAGIEPTSKV